MYVYPVLLYNKGYVKTSTYRYFETAYDIIKYNRTIHNVRIPDSMQKCEDIKKP